MKNILHTWLAVLLLSVPALAETTCDDANVCCSQCGQKVCCPEVKDEDVTKTCWDTECKEVCIPPIRLPWDCCCELSCGGFVRSVNVLKETEYETTKISYSWKPVCASCQAQSHCGQHGTGCSACDEFARNQAQPTRNANEPNGVAVPQMQLVSHQTRDNDAALQLASADASSAHNRTASVVNKTAATTKNKSWWKWFKKDR